MNQRPIPQNNKPKSNKSNNRPTTKPKPKPKPSPAQPTGEVPSGFHNPYNFIPAPSRKVDHETLGDHHPKGHGTYHTSLWSGQIAVTLTTKTPLLVPDAAKVKVADNDHKTFPVRLDNQGKPYLAPTAIKGMLRAAYEAATNSRFGVFEQHSDRLAYRMQAEIGPIPARVEASDQGELQLRVMQAGVPGYAGKLPRYQVGHRVPRDKGESTAAKRYQETNDLPQHGEHVWVQLGNAGYINEIMRWSSRPADITQWKEGWVCITGANIKAKKSERVFLSSDTDRIIPVDDNITSLWEELVRNYQEVHTKDLESRRQEGTQPYHYLGENPGKTAWSRHVHIKSEARLKEGTLCYVELQGNEVTGVQPVTISRRLFTRSPNQIVHRSLKPAIQMSELSPADRVFGWVNQKGKGAYKGNVRVNSVTCNTADAVENFTGQGLPLAILGQPNPQQFRFYLAEGKGESLSPTTRKEQGYSKGQTLRGRKVYPHHRHMKGPDWDLPENTSREYVGSERTNQNRSLLGWVKPDVTFTFNISITNLSTVELGGLLWLLTLPNNHYHRLGGGKPLGFGSVSLTLDEDKTDLRTGEQWQTYYGSLLPVDVPICDFGKVMTAYKDAVGDAYGDKPPAKKSKKGSGLSSGLAGLANLTAIVGPPFDRVPFIQSFLVMASGFEDLLPIHYPRTTVAPNPNGEGFDWFVDNERTSGQRLPLPLLTEDKGLPFSPTNNR